MADRPSSSPLPDLTGQADSSPKLAVIVPTVYEAGNIRTLIERIRGALRPLGIGYELIVVDDDSRDGIDEIVSEIARRDPRIRLLVRKGVRGLAGAVIHGWRNTEAEVLGVIDADLPEEQAHVGLHGVDAQDELVGDLLVRRRGDEADRVPVYVLVDDGAVVDSLQARDLG